MDDLLAAIVRIKRSEAKLIEADREGDEDSAQVAFDAVLYNLVVIGEAVNALPTEITARDPGVPWRDIVDMRDFLSHTCLRVLVDVVRRTIDEPLEQLRGACRRLQAADEPGVAWQLRGRDGSGAVRVRDEVIEEGVVGPPAVQTAAGCRPATPAP
jgi:uncharacterized protein with HEPN domain